MFQSTRPRGARLDCLPGCASKMLVSIHAPARGATSRRSRSRPGGSRFNPRARAGRDFRLVVFDIKDVGFNPRARAGRDRCRRGQRGRGPCFNPRARAGRDLIFLGEGVVMERFNPRARAGRDSGSGPRPLRIVSFNPRARAGRDGAYGGAESRHDRVSIHAPARGATADPSMPTTSAIGFNPRARAGRDQS